jgi:coenzyme PQQ precursor peptide PqqA
MATLGRTSDPLNIKNEQHYKRRGLMKVWSKPQVREQEVGLEVTSYLPAEIDII